MARFNLRPRPKPKPSKAPFPFLALPTELRLQIYNYLLLSEPSCSYIYIDISPPPLRQHRRRSPFRRHGMLLANRQLHAEYMQAFYERTSFSFCIDTDNGMWVATVNGMYIATVPFLTPPPALLRNLRQCKLCVDLGMLPCGPVLSTKAYVARVEALLGRMEQVRWVHLVWVHPMIMGPPLWEEGEELRELRKLWRKGEGLWEQLGERFVQRLKGRAGMRGMIVTVGERTLKLEREGAEWVEREVVPY